MDKNKKAAEAEGKSPLDIAKELHDITSTWRQTYVLTGSILELVKSKIQELYYSLSPEE